MSAGQGPPGPVCCREQRTAVTGQVATADPHRPLGTVAAIEFLPVIALAAVAARTKRNGVALVLAVVGRVHAD